METSNKSKLLPMVLTIPKSHLSACEIQCTLSNLYSGSEFSGFHLRTFCFQGHSLMSQDGFGCHNSEDCLTLAVKEYRCEILVSTPDTTDNHHPSQVVLEGSGLLYWLLITKGQQKVCTIMGPGSRAGLIDASHGLSFS